MSAGVPAAGVTLFEPCKGGFVVGVGEEPPPDDPPPDPLPEPPPELVGGLLVGGVGLAPTVTDLVPLPVPPLFVHVTVKFLEVVRLLIVAEPLALVEELKSFLHEGLLLALQLTVVDPPYGTEFGLTDTLTPGGFCLK